MDTPSNTPDLVPEFKVGDAVTFQPYEEAIPAIVREVLPNHFGDGRVVYYLLGDYQPGYVTEGGEWRRPVRGVVSTCSGECIRESRYFQQDNGYQTTHAA